MKPAATPGSRGSGRTTARAHRQSALPVGARTTSGTNSTRARTLSARVRAEVCPERKEDLM